MEGTKPRIILLTPPPISEILLRKHLPQHVMVRSRETTFAYSQAVMDLNVPDFVEKLDLHEAIQLAPAKSYIAKPTLHSGVTGDLDPMRFENGGMTMDLEEYLSDGLHLKDPSYKIMFNLVMDCIRRRWSEITPEKLSMPVQWWGDIVAKSQQKDEL